MARYSGKVSAQHWMKIVQQRERIVEELQVKTIQMQTKAKLLEDPMQKEEKQKEIQQSEEELDRLFKGLPPPLIPTCILNSTTPLPNYVMNCFRGHMNGITSVKIPLL